MITHGAEKIINSNEEYVHRHFFLKKTVHLLHCRLVVNADIDAIIQCGEERTMELNNKYETLNLEDLSNFKSEASVQQWEGEDFRTGVSNPLQAEFSLRFILRPQQRKQLNFNLLSLSKRERKANYSVDSYFKDTLRAGPAKTEKAPKLPRAPKQIAMFLPVPYDCIGVMTDMPY